MPEPDPSSVRHPGPWRHLDVHANGIRLHAVETGPDSPNAPLVVLLHGFADYWFSWRRQLVELGAAGYRTVAVDLRGYGDSDKPPRGYDGWTLAGDIAALVLALGHDTATLIGHGDGGFICWATAKLHPNRVSSIATVSAPHPLGLRRAILRDRAQRTAAASSLFGDQLPRLAERRLTDNDGLGAELLLRARAGPRWPRAADFAESAAHARSAIRILGVAHCALEYHRWAVRSQFRPDGRRFRAAMDGTVAMPVLQINGEHDPYILASTYQFCTRWAPQRRLITLNAGHFAHQEAPMETTAALLSFLAEHQPLT